MREWRIPFVGGEAGGRAPQPSPAWLRLGRHDPLAADRAGHGDRADLVSAPPGSTANSSTILEARLHVEEAPVGRGGRVHRARVGRRVVPNSASSCPPKLSVKPLSESLPALEA